jgi:hypothetical protein
MMDQPPTMPNEYDQDHLASVAKVQVIAGMVQTITSCINVSVFLICLTGIAVAFILR